MASRRAPAIAADVPRVPWAAFLPSFLELWQAGEHVTIIGPTGEGKTVLLLALVKGRHEARGAHVVLLATKPRDRVLSSFGWPRLTEWPPAFDQTAVVLWPKYGTPATAPARQRAAFRPALEEIFRDGARTVAFDEVGYLEEELRLGPIVRQYLTQGRSVDLTVVSATQRPRAVSRVLFSEPSWFFFFQTTDDDELRRVAEIGGDTAAIRAGIRELRPHEFLCVRPRRGEMVISKVTRRS